MKKFFNLVEVTLAIAVVGIGIAGVMSLFPVGLNSMKDAITESYGTDVAEQFMSYISRYCKENWETVLWTSGNADPAQIPDSIQYITADTDEATAATSWCTDVNAYEGVIYYPLAGSATGKLEFFKILRKTGGIIDFEAAMRMWKQPITDLDIAGQPVDFSDGSLAASKYKYGAVLYVEISWPYGKPYSKREKRYFCKVLMRPM